MRFGLIVALRRWIVNRAIEKGRIDERSSLMFVNPYLMRYVEEDRCVDIYVERSSSEVLFDRMSVARWHSRKYDYLDSDPSAEADDEQIDDKDRKRICDVVESELRKRGGKLVVIN